MRFWRAPRWVSYKILAGFLGLTALLGGLALWFDWSAPARAGLVVGVCLVLWLTEWTPLWIPTLLLWVAVPLVFVDAGPAFRPLAVIRWSADPVLVLFLGGFSLAVAAERWGLDAWLLEKTLRLSRGEPYRLMALVAAATVGLSMWMSNIAATALVLGALRSITESTETSDHFRRALLLTVALAADVGGIATPIGSGPNGIAISAIERSHRITFVDWMAFGTPLAIGLVLAVLLYARVRFGAAQHQRFAIGDGGRSLTTPALVFTGICGITVLLWLTEPLHHISAWKVALGTTCVLVACRLLTIRELRNIDWQTLLLIAGGIALGALLQQAGVIRLLMTLDVFQTFPRPVVIFGLCLLCACLSALMSNTGTAASLVPLAVAIDPSPSTAVLIAVSASLGVPFVISTPPNAMAVAQGLPATDLLVPGGLLLVGGCVLVALTGPPILQLMGIP